jgi:hypothetical protein
MRAKLTTAALSPFPPMVPLRDALLAIEAVF